MCAGGYFERFEWWRNLHSGIRRYIVNRFERFTPVQEQGIPHILEGVHTLLIAPTGTGKTEAALFPVLSMMLSLPERSGISVLYITPLRALNRDMMDRVSGLCGELGIQFGVRHADTSKSERRSQVLHPPDILITTPETAQLLMYGKRMRENLRGLKWVIVDEVHELFTSERGIQFSIVMERLSKVSEFQRVGLSATVARPEDVLNYLIGIGRKGCIIDVTSEEKMEIRVDVPEPNSHDQKNAEAFGISVRESAALRQVLREVEMCPGGVLLFVNTRKTAEHLAYMLRKMTDTPFRLHHGSLSKEIRMRAEEEFKSGKVRLMICTSSLELGIDVGTIDLVIQYGSPRQATRMIQRIGRSGHRVGATSRGLIISPGLLDAVESDILAERVKHHKIEHLHIRKMALAPLANQVIAEACANGKVNRNEFYDVVRRAYPYKDLHRTVYEDLISMLVSIRMVNLSGDDILTSARSREYFTTTVSMIPDESKVRVIDSVTRNEVGTLDEAFARSLRPGETFIMHGNALEVISLTQDCLISSDVTESGMLPSWVGEEIPVDQGVAREVLLAISSGYTIHRGIPPPDEMEISECKWLLEASDRDCVLILPLGTCGGVAFAHFIGALLSGGSGESARVSPTPYGVVFTLPRGFSVDRLLKTLKEVEDVQPIITASVRRSPLYRYRFIQSARKFGVLSQRADLAGVNIDSVIKSYQGTPLDDDVMDKILTEDMDVHLIQGLIRMYREGRADVRIRQGFSALAKCLIEDVEIVLYPERARRLIAEIIRERLEKRRVCLLCISCTRVIMRRVSSLAETLRCPRCGSGMLALCDDPEKVIKLLKKKHLTQEEKKIISKMRLSADLIRAFGKKAIITLSAHGVGEVTAARILNKRRQTDEEFYMDIVDAEVAYEQTHRFWE